MCIRDSNNAGYGRWGELTSHERDDYSKMLQLNVTTLTDLCHLYIPEMVTNGGGGIINVGSMASLSPIPYASVYSSSKAYVLMFSEAIRFEYQDKGINVMALLPGGTESEFASVATEKSEKLTKRYQQREGTAAGGNMQTSQEVPNLRSQFPNKLNLMVNLANDSIGYIIPKSEWDEDAPWIYGENEETYGEVVSLGPNTAPIIHEKLVKLIEESKSK